MEVTRDEAEDGSVVYTVKVQAHEDAEIRAAADGMDLDPIGWWEKMYDTGIRSWYTVVAARDEAAAALAADQEAEDDAATRH